MMRPPILQVALFRQHATDPDEHERSRYAMLYLLDALVAIDRLWLQQYPEAPWLYASGVRYIYKDAVEAAAWQDIPTTLDKGYGDCKDFAAWRVAELLERLGVNATPAIQWRLVDGSWRLHALVQFDDGSLEDPSRVLGMGSDEPFKKQVVPLPDVSPSLEGAPVKPTNKARAILAGLVSPNDDDRARAAQSLRSLNRRAKGGDEESDQICAMVRQGAAAYRRARAEMLGVAGSTIHPPAFRPPPGGARAAPPAPPRKLNLRGHAQLQALQQKAKQVFSKVNSAKVKARARGAVVRGAEVLGDATQDAVDTINQQQQYCQQQMTALQAQDAQIQAMLPGFQQAAQAFQLAVASTPQGGASSINPNNTSLNFVANTVQGMSDTLTAKDQDLQNQIQAVSAQLDNLSALVDNLNQSAQQLLDQQAYVQQGLQQYQDLQQQLQAGPDAYGPDYGPDAYAPSAMVPYDGGDGGASPDDGSEPDYTAEDMMGAWGPETLGDDGGASQQSDSQKVGAVLQSVAPAAGLLTDLIPFAGPLLAPLATDTVKQAGKLLTDAKNGDKVATTAIANTAAKARAGDPQAQSDMDALSRVNAVHKAASKALEKPKPFSFFGWNLRALYRAAISGPPSLSIH